MKILALLLMVVLACNPRMDKREVELAGTPRGGDFSIPSTEGVFKTNDHRGEILFIFFGFAHCPYICPTTLKNLSVMKKSLTPDEQKKLRILFISIDNERDTVENLKEVSQIYGDRIISATDTDHNLREIAIKFGAGFSKRKNKDGEWIFDHTDKVYVINSKGEWVDTQAYNVTASVFKEAFHKADKLPALSEKSQHTRVKVLGGNLDCDLNKGACSADVEGEKISLTISPNPIKIQKPLVIDVTSTSKEIKPESVDFLGFGENMGYIRPELSSEGQNHFKGAVTLPVCEIADMYWIARVVVRKPDGPGIVEFSFKTNQ